MTDCDSTFRNGKVMAIGFNCSAPGHITGALKEARAAAQRLLEADPANLEAKHLLAFSHAAGEAEGGDLARAVRLGLEIVTSDQVTAWP